jgi:hypothetical protein
MTTRSAGLVLALTFLLSSAGGAQVQPRPVVGSYTAMASNISSIAPAGITQLDIEVRRLTDAGENERLMTAFEEKGQQGLIDALQDTKPVGYMRAPGQLAYEFHYANVISEKNGVRRLLLITDRPMSFGEVVNRGRSTEYPFTLMDLRIDSSGRGEGKLFLATKIIRSGDLFVLENYASQPIVVSDVERKKS